VLAGGHEAAVGLEGYAYVDVDLWQQPLIGWQLDRLKNPCTRQTSHKYTARFSTRFSLLEDRDRFIRG
jgi:hypothetical protein